MGFAEIDHDEIANRFGFHPATNETRPMHRSVREIFIDTANDLISLIPDGREKALMLTALEEASMWANAGIARNMAPLKLGE